MHFELLEPFLGVGFLLDSFHIHPYIYAAIMILKNLWLIGDFVVIEQNMEGKGFGVDGNFFSLAI